MLKPLVRKALREIGLGRIRHPSFADIMRHDGIETVLDVGANDGGFGAEVREQGYKGRIVSFEPIPTVFRTLEARCAVDPLWDAFCLGIGDAEGSLPIGVAADTVFSSFKRASDYAAGKFAGARVERTEVVPVVRLDAFLSTYPQFTSAAYLKIDTQGFEKEVLLGAGDFLQSFKGIQLEVAVRQLYDGQDTMVSMIRWMEEKGFKLALAKENGFDWQAMRLLEMDLLFVPRW